MKKLAFFCVLALCFCLIPVSAAEGFEEAGVLQQDGSILYTGGRVPASDKNIVYSGRWLEKDGSCYGAWEGYCEISFTGTSLRAVCPKNAQVYVQVDGGQEKPVQLTKNSRLASQLEEGAHIVRIYAAAQHSMPAVSGFILDENSFTLPIEEKPVIEFIGDSITEGYIRPGDNSYLFSYAYACGTKLNWQFYTVAYGGIAMTPGYGSTDQAKGMLNRWPLWAEVGEDPAETVWDTARHRLDYMVINLGTNDAAASPNEFKAAYLVFLNKVRAAYPDITVFMMTPFNGRFRTEITELAALFEENVVLVDAAAWELTGGEYTTDGTHLNETAHAIAAQKLYEAILAYRAPVTTAPAEHLPIQTQEGNRMLPVLTGGGICILLTGAAAAGFLLKKHRRKK